LKIQGGGRFAVKSHGCRCTCYNLLLSAGLIVSTIGVIHLFQLCYLLVFTCRHESYQRMLRADCKNVT